MNPQTLTRPAAVTPKQIVIGFLGLGVIVLVAVLFLVFSPSPKAGSSFDVSPWGSQLFYQYLQGQASPNLDSDNRNVQRWQRDYRHLSGQGQVLFQISDRQVLQTEGLDSELQTWVDAGNTLIRLTWSGPPLSPTPTTQISSPQGPVQVDTRRRQELLSDELSGSESTAQTLLGDPAGAVIWSREQEAGQVIYGVYPWLVANAYKTTAANFAYVADLAWARGQTILFDEWLHGYRQIDPNDALNSAQYRNFWDYLRRTPWLLILLQALVIGLVLIWGKNHRLGPVIRDVQPTATNSEQYIQALASVLHQAQHHDFVQAQLSQRFRALLAEKLGLRGAWAGHESNLSNEVLIQAWREQTGKPTTDLEIVLGPTPTNLSESELTAWGQRAREILRGLG